MDLILIRHAESENNRKYGRIKEKWRRKLGTETYEWKAKASAEYHPVRSSDPALTLEGARQAVRLGKRMAQELKKSKNVLVFASPMRRAISTAYPMATEVKARVNIRADLCEVYGMYATRVVGPENRHEDYVPGDVASGAQLQAEYPIVDTSALPPEGPWYTSAKETEAEARVRARRVVRWLMSEELGARVGRGGTCVVVSHGHFLDYVFKELCAVHGDAEFTRGGPLRFRSRNTAVTRVSVRGASGRDFEIFMGELPHMETKTVIGGDSKVTADAVTLAAASKMPAVSFANGTQNNTAIVSTAALALIFSALGFLLGRRARF